MDGTVFMDGMLRRCSSNATASALTLQLELRDFNRRRLTPAPDPSAWELELSSEVQSYALERYFVETERAQIADQAARAPSNPEAFVTWFEDLEATGPGQGHPLFLWLAQHSTLEQLKWFLNQELAGEAGFDDLVALTQVKLPPQAKLELARNYWDEMGRGHASGMHGPMLERLAQELEIDGRDVTVWESLALGNLMTALATRRCYAFHSIGALGVIELTAPGRARFVNEGLKRLGVNGVARQYFALHATVDVRHSSAWNQEVIAPLVAADPRLARPIAEGALMRLRAGERCFERYARELRIPLY